MIAETLTGPPISWFDLSPLLILLGAALVLLVAASLTDASQAYFPGGGHSIGLSDGCSQSIIASFLGALGVDAATTACAAAAFPVAYETPGKTTRYATTPLDDAAVDAIVDRLRRRLR